MPQDATTLVVPRTTKRGGPEFVQRLHLHGDHPALITGARVLSYAELDRAVDERVDFLGPQRRLIALPVASTVDCVVTLLAALRGGHVVMPLPPCTAEAIWTPYSPDAVWQNGRLTVLNHEARHDLHPDLALLLSTSGTTGSAKLVRLSAANLASNAEAIAASLELTPQDRGITTLALSYSYGLSVLTSHLAAGAGLVLTEESVTSPSFGELVDHSGVTTLAGVPYSISLMERTGLLDRSLPRLRLLTCAGGRLDPERARDLVRRGRRAGWGLVLMYGQTEATARIAYLPAHLAGRHPDHVGRAIRGGRLRIDHPDEGGVGEIVYSGPNVMMGYATSPADLSRGPELTELRTGDLGLITADGLLQVRGRLARTAKVRGLRISLDDVERALQAQGIDGSCVGLDDGIAVAVASTQVEHARVVAAQACSLPTGLITAVSVPELPRTDTGKVDGVAVTALVERAIDSQQRDPMVSGTDAAAAGMVERLQHAYAVLLAVEAQPTDSFVSLGGDSLSFVEVSVAVEQLIGTLPPDWHQRTIEDLAGMAGVDAVRASSSSGPRRLLGWRTMDATVVIRALAIALVVGSHAQAFDLRGGAHVLLALVGFNIARFHLGVRSGRDRLRRMWRSTARVLVPSMLFLLALVITGRYGWYLLGVNFIVNPSELTPEWRYWFIETLAWILPIVVVVVALPWVETVRRRYPLGLPLVVTAVLFAAGRLLVPQEFPISVFSPLAIAWILTLGWAIAEVRTTRQRMALTLLLVAVVPWTLYGVRMLVVPLGLLVLLWVSRLRLPLTLALVAGALAEASLVIYLLHWPVLDAIKGWPGAVLSCLIGVAASWMITRGRRNMRVTAENISIHTNR